VRAAGLSKENVKSILVAFNVAVKRLPYEIKPWAEYARFLAELGRYDDAEAVLREGTV
jgi:hypothetical protein